MGRRNNNTHYILSVRTTAGKDKYEELDNLQQIADTINHNYFSGFEVVSRSMVNNWLYYPNQLRRAYADRFTIEQIQV